MEMELVQLCYFKSPYYNLKVLKPRFFQLSQVDKKIKKFNPKGSFYDVLESKPSLKLIRHNIKNLNYPCFNLRELYNKKPETDLKYLAKGRYIGQILKSCPLLLYIKEDFSKKWLLKIPHHILLTHLSEWTGVKVFSLAQNLAKSLVKVIYLQGIEPQQVQTFKLWVKDFDKI